MIDDYLLINFKRYYPHLADQVLRYATKGYSELIVRLTNDRVIVYFEYDNTIKTICKDCTNLTEDDYRQNFALCLKRMLYLTNHTQGYLSEKVGITEAMISRYLHCKATPSWYTLNRIARALDCSVYDLNYNWLEE